MRMPSSAHTSQAWHIHDLTRDFRLEDVWALPTPGGADDFARLIEVFAAFDPARSSSAAVRMLFAIRRQLGALLGWDAGVPGAGDSSDQPSLRERLPEDLRPSDVQHQSDLPFTPLYRTEREWAAEIVNRTVHGVVHLGWVPATNGGYRGQMAIYVQPKGLLGAAYMTAIRPFRYAIVYPQILRDVGRAWRQLGHAPTPAAAQPSRHT